MGGDKGRGGERRRREDRVGMKRERRSWREEGRREGAGEERKGRRKLGKGRRWRSMEEDGGRRELVASDNTEEG